MSKQGSFSLGNGRESGGEARTHAPGEGWLEEIDRPSLVEQFQDPFRKKGEGEDSSNRARRRDFLR